MKQKLRNLAKHLLGKRGALFIVAVAAGAAALLMGPGTLGTALGIVALLAGAAFGFLVSYRLSQVHTRGTGQAPQVPPALPTSRPVTTPLSIDSDTRERAELVRALGYLHHLEGAPDPEPGSEVPDITVVMPCYNEEAFVEEAIASVAAQTFPNWECLIVDDASTDSSLTRIVKATKGDHRFRVIRHKVNSGLSASRNTGLRYARGGLVTFLDGDDLLMADSLQDRFRAYIEQASDPHVAGSFCGVKNVPEDARLSELPNRMKWHEEWGDKRIVDLVTARGECPFSAHAPLIRADVVRGLGGFSETMRNGAEDWDLWLRVMRNGYTFTPANYRTAVYRQKGASMIRTSAVEHALTASELIERAHMPATDNVIRYPSPTPLLEPLAAYDMGLTKVRRLLRFAATSLTVGNTGGAAEILGSLPELPRSLVERHVDIDDQFARGVSRAIRYTGRDLEPVANAASGIRAEFDRLLSTHFTEPATGRAHTPKTMDLLIVPQHVAQLRTMIEVVSSADIDWGVLMTDRDGGDQGVRSALPTTVDAWSVNQWWLGEISARAVLVGGARDAMIEEVVALARASGIEILTIEEATDRFEVLPDAPTRIEGRPAGETLSALKTAQPVVLSLWRDYSWGSDGAPPLWATEENPETSTDREAIASFRDRHKGERLVVIGNGPSLNKLDLSKLKSEYTIGVNGIFYARDEMGFDPTYYVVEDTAVMADNLEMIKAYQAGHKFFPSIYRDKVGKADNVSYFMMNRGFYSPSSPNFCIPRFSTDVTQQVFCGQSVTIINLQLAYHMGFSEIVLIGMDFSYVIPDDAEVDGNLITSAGDDPNHFHPDYFGKGKVWKDPKLDRVLASYSLAKRVFEADGRRIVNATVGGELHLFERVDYESLFS
jgi:glycosyltransferase involved in cell wall biosynthesis